MNNGKVRIYELSKELNLDNKDILEICDQLNISVKSHSSTITESQAERIKATAEKYAASHTASRSSTKSKRERKQQILAIHHKQSRQGLLSGASASAKSTTPILASPPRPPVKSQPPQPPTLSPTNCSIAESAPSGIAPTEPQPKALKSHASQPPEVAEEDETGLDSSEARSLLAPPVRPMAKPSEEKVTEPPIAKPPQKASTSTKAPSTHLTSSTSPKQTEPTEEEPVAKKQPDKLKAKPLLQKPQSPKLAQEATLKLAEPPAKLEPETSSKEDGEEESLETLKQKPKLKRPEPPRPKRQKWEEEEEEEREAKNKSGKSTNKGKRRSQSLIEDEDEDFALALENSPLPTAVSLSVARPPKPKSQDRPPAVAVGSNKPKKAPVKTDGGTGRLKADRRERKESDRPPEKILLDSNLTIRELSELLKTPETEIIKNLFFKGIAVNITQTLDLQTARLVAEELGITVETPEEKAAATKTTEMLSEKDLENLQLRPPVVTIMGHVDHGKTTLLDSIRQTKVAQGEAGGITQHIGAYHVDVEHNGKPEQIVFLDTPGHEAFTAMRARGARVTDIAILVVAADDGVQPQTREAISHAKAAEVPLVVAINKIDKLEANPDRIKQELSELGLVPEEWGGDTIMVPVSALKGENLDALLEMILLVSELEELSANPDRPAKGTVIEAHLDRSRGPVATLLVQNGTLRVGDVIVAGSVFGKIRALIDDRGNKVEAASPSFAAEILGLNDVPAAGDEFEVFESEKEARLLAEQREESHRQSRLQQAMATRRVTLSTISAQAQEGELKELNLILKADVQGSIEAILGSLEQLPQDEVQIRVLLAAPGEVTETDVDLAAASGAVIVGFNTTLASGARSAADREGVDIREYDIIYKLLDDIQGAMEGLLDPEEIESPLGQAEVRAVFPVGRGSVAGCYVQSGKIVRNRFLRVRRGGETIYEGTIDSLRRIKEDAREVNAGYECGIGVAKFNDWKEGDIIEAYEMVMKRRTLSTQDKSK